MESIHIAFNLETNTEELTADDEENVIVRLTTAMITSIYNKYCTRRLGFSRTRELLVGSISSGTRFYSVGNCTAMSSHSKSCTMYKGSLLVAYDNIGALSTAPAVNQSVIDTLSTNMDNGSYLDSVNSALLGVNVTITKIVYGTFPPKSSPPTATSVQKANSIPSGGSLTNVGKALIFLATFFFFCLIIACFCWKRSYEFDNNESDEVASMLKDEGPVDTECGTDDEKESSVDFDHSMEIHNCMNDQHYEASEPDTCRANLSPILEVEASEAPSEKEATKLDEVMEEEPEVKVEPESGVDEFTEERVEENEIIEEEPEVKKDSLEEEAETNAEEEPEIKELTQERKVTFNDTIEMGVARSSSPFSELSAPSEASTPLSFILTPANTPNESLLDSILESLPTSQDMPCSRESMKELAETLTQETKRVSQDCHEWISQPRAMSQPPMSARLAATIDDIFEMGANANYSREAKAFLSDKLCQEPMRSSRGETSSLSSMPLSTSATIDDIFEIGSQTPENGDGKPSRPSLLRISRYGSKRVRTKGQAFMERRQVLDKETGFIHEEVEL